MKPVWKWVIGVALCLIVMVLIANWYVTHTLKPRMEAELKARVIAGTDGRYRLVYDQLEVSLFSGTAVATNVRLIPDTSAIRRSQSASTATYRVRIGRLQVKGVSMLPLLISKRLRINTVALDTPSIHVGLDGRADTIAGDTTSGSFLERLASTLSDIRVKRFVLRAGAFELTHAQDASHLQVEHINMTARDIRIDSASLRDTLLLYGAKDLDVEMESLDYIRPDSLYQLHTGPLHFQTATQELTLHSLRYGLTVSKAAFYRQVQLAKDISDIAISRISLIGIDVPRWVRDETIAAGALRIDSGSIGIYKDKTQPNPPENKIGKSPHQRLMQLEQSLHIDSVLVNALDISFTEVSDQTGKAGTVTFEATHGVIQHVTNDSLALARDRFMRLRARSRVMGACDLNVNLRFDLLDSLGAHTYEGKLGPVSGAVFNRMLTPQLNVEVKSANIRGLRFAMEANDRRTTGTLQLDYDNLKVNMLREDNDGGTSTKPVLSFFANRFLLNDSNPDANGVHHTGQVYIERPHSFSFFKMIWRSIREGTKECIGM